MAWAGYLLAIALAAAPVAAAAQTEAPQTQARQLFLFHYAPGPAWREGVPMREQGLAPHGAYMARLQEEGRLFAGGGYVGADGGLAIVLAADIEEARAVLAADPAVLSGIFVGELRQWRPRFRSDDPLPAGD
jgi:uncharacterized protein YciI